MSWDDWNAFWAMGGYGVYVWGAYLLVMAVILSEIATLLVSRHSILAHLGFFSVPRSDSRCADTSYVGKSEVSK